MVGLKPHTTVDGWAENVQDMKGDPTILTFRQRLAENTRLWFVCLAIVLVIATVVGISSIPQDKEHHFKKKSVSASPVGTFDDSEHSAFARKLASDFRYSSSVLEARFVAAGTFEIVMTGSSGRDEIETVSKMAGLRIKRRFGENVVVLTYVDDASSHKRTHVADTMWDDEEAGFVAHFKDVASGTL